MSVDDVLVYPHQIGDALWRIDAASVPRTSGPGGLVVCGAPAGDLAAAVLGDRATAPVRDGAPADGAFVLCASYSGDDPDALACFDEAGRLGCPRAVVCTAGELATRARDAGVPVIGVPGGMPDPDNAVVYFLLAALECAAACGAAPSLRAEAEAAYAPLEQLDADVIARELAERLRGRTPVIEGEPAVTARWRRLIGTDGPEERVAPDLSPASDFERILALILLGDLTAHHLAP